MYYKYNKDIITHAQAQAVIDSLIRVVLHPLGVLLDWDLVTVETIGEHCRVPSTSLMS